MKSIFLVLQLYNILLSIVIRWLIIFILDDPATLFRRDSMATKAARIFFSLVAKSYLKRMILSFVAYVTCEVGKGNSYEVSVDFYFIFFYLFYIIFYYFILLIVYFRWIQLN